MKRKILPTSISDFKQIIEENRYYVDKTMLIEEILRKKSGVLLITRPRRFGKTMGMSTLKYFLDIKDREKNRELFRDLNIEKTEYISEQGKYPVILLSMKEIGGERFSDFTMRFRTLMSGVYDKFEYLRDSMNEKALQFFDKVWLEKENTNYSEALKFLSEELYRFHGIKPVLLIDEYDTPMLNANEKGYYDDAKDLIGVFYGSALKDGVCSFAVVTGILRVAKESIFSTLNNLKVSTVLTGDYNHFGMVEEEVIEILKHYGLEKTLEDTKKWYNGYLFGEKRIYNPWSIVSYCEEGKLEGFWMNTSSNLLIKEMLRDADGRINDIFHALMKGEGVKTTLNENMIFGQKYSNSIVLYLMFSSGYLTISGKGEERREYYLTIPNYEVKEYFRDTFMELISNDSVDSFTLLKEALVDGNIHGMDSVEELLNEMFQSTISYWDTSREEKFYHNLVIGMIAGLNSKFHIHSNRESGLGRYDLAIEPKDKNKTGYIFEFKIAKPQKSQIKMEKEMDRLGKEALEQIENKIYSHEMRDRGIKNIVSIGMVFCGKIVKVYS